MDVVKFKKTGDVYFVQYEENQDIKTLKTEDEPESRLITAMDNAALAVLKLFNISDISCKLQAMEWKDGEKAGSKCILLSGESQFGQFKMALSKVSTQDAETPEEGIYDPGETKNQYNKAADVLRAEVKRFAEGARRQRVLPFKDEAKKDEAEDGKKKKGKGIFRAAADKAAGLFGQTQ
jgi:protein-tyrosine-phosphatase